MGALIAIGIKGSNGKYYNYTISINDNTDDYGNNVSMWVEQTVEERNNKVPKQYVGNGKVIWTDGTIKLATKKGEKGMGIADIVGMSNPTNQQSNIPIQQQQNTINENSENKFNDDDFYTGDSDDLPF